MYDRRRIHCNRSPESQELPQQAITSYQTAAVLSNAAQVMPRRDCHPGQSFSFGQGGPLGHNEDEER